MNKKGDMMESELLEVKKDILMLKQHFAECMSSINNIIDSQNKIIKNLAATIGCKQIAEESCRGSTDWR